MRNIKTINNIVIPLCVALYFLTRQNAKMGQRQRNINAIRVNLWLNICASVANDFNNIFTNTFKNKI